MPSSRFLLTVDPISDNGIRSIQTTATKFIKKWLRLPRNATQAILFHPEALNCPHLPTERLKAKVSQLATISTSRDVRIQEINFNLSTPSFVKALHIPNEAVNILHSAQSSIAGLPHAKQLIKLASASIKFNTTSHWNTHLSSLSVQCKLTEAIHLEQESQVWKRIRDGLPAGQLSFILCAASDTLPTPLNLRRWKIQCGAKCSLCGNSRPTVAHILNGCPVALEQGRYTWRHDCVLSTITSALRCHTPSETTIYADLPNLRATEHPSSTIPPSILVTPLKPDLVLLHNGDNQATVIELTCPTNTKSNLSAARSRKQNREAYGILFSDMANQGWTVNYETLEIGSLGHYQREMRPLLSSVLDLPKKPTQDLLDRCAKAAISCSYHIFLARNSPSWSPPSLLSF